ncbi:MAG: hypothetical protein AAFX44_11900, partial [Pseudomonadota bacterium]
RQIAQASGVSPVWQRGFHDYGIRDTADHLACVRYVIENPVRAGLVAHPSDYSFLICPASY